MVFGHMNFWLMFRILKLIYFPPITNEETYVAVGVQRNRVLAGFHNSAPGLMVPLNEGGGPRVVVSTAAFHARVRFPVSAVWKKQKMFLSHPRVKVSIVGSLRDREVVCSASDRQGSNFESCVWRTVSSQSSHHPQEVLLAQFSLYVHKGGLKPVSFHFLLMNPQRYVMIIYLYKSKIYLRRWSNIDPTLVTVGYLLWYGIFHQGCN